MILQNFSFWMMLCRRPRVQNFLFLLNFLLFLVYLSFCSVLYSINYFSFRFSYISISSFTITRKAWLKRNISLLEIKSPTSAISLPANAIIMFSNFLLFHYFTILLNFLMFFEVILSGERSVIVNKNVT